MESLGTGLIVLGVFGFLVSLVALIVALVRKKKKKLWLLSFVAFLALAIIGGGILSDTESGDKTKKPSTAVKPEKTVLEKVVEVRICSRDGVNIRVGPGINYEKDRRGPLKKGERIYILQDERDWVRFRLTKRNSGWSGWVKKSLTITEEEERKKTIEATVEQEKAVIPKHTILNEELYDVPIKTQVTLNVLVSGEITEPGLRALLNQLYSSIKARKGFKYHDSPTNIYIYAFTSKERAESGMGQWIAMLQKSPGDAKATISINERQITQLGAKPEERFGLSEEKRKGIWKELVLVEDRAMEEALEQYPEEFEKQVEMERRLIDDYKNKLAEKYELTREQLQEISVEGVEKDWPFPK